jgi:hydrogenase maturation protein HypF
MDRQMDKRRKTKRIRLYGIVQGVGFRPFVSRAAMEQRIAGTVCNRGSYVEVIAQGTQEELDRFLLTLSSDPPERSVILKIDIRDAGSWPDLETFEIAESEKERGDIFISPDIATCPECRRELYDPGNRRYLHPFINCTCCGPRLTILDNLPYDRERTSMSEFPMCDKCAEEYNSPLSRRYDAQPVCCNECGPEVYLLEKNGSIAVRGNDAIVKTREVIRHGGIAAIKGIGGFHLCCDATNPDAVARLRRLKTRPQ